MPTVKSGKKTKEFAYTKKGKEAARQYALKTNGKLTVKRKEIMKGKIKR